MIDPKLQKSKYINLVLSSTGSLYPALVGGVYALMEQGYTFKAISGTSGGAIIGISLATDISKERLKRLFIDYNPWPKLLTKISHPFSGRWGFFNSQDASSSLFEKLGGNITFRELKKPLYIVATQVLPFYDKFIFCKETTPDIKIAEAARISSAIPILFTSIVHQGKTLVDGSLTDNLHIRPFEEEFDQTIALSLEVVPHKGPKSFWQFISSSLSLWLSGQGSSSYTPKGLTFIPINLHDFSSPISLSFSRNQKIQLFDLGYNSVINYLKDTKE